MPPGDSVGPVETRFLKLPVDLVLQNGEMLTAPTVAYEVYGELNEDRSNAVLVFHALTGSQHAAGVNSSVPGVDDRWTEDIHVGWWDDFIGPGKALDTNQFAVICANYLGSCYGSTGPSSTDPGTGRRYGSAFPRISLSDVVDSQLLLLDHLGIERLHAAIGGSVGGLMALSLATRYPDRVEVVIPIAAGLGVTALQRIHNFEQSLAIENDPLFCGGDYYGGSHPERGLALARMIGHKTFVSLHAMEERARSEVVVRDETGGHVQITNPLESYMWHQGTKFVRRFDANSYLHIMELWQTFDLLEQAGEDDLDKVLQRCRGQRFMVFSIDSDVCFYPDEQEELAGALKRAGVAVQRITVHSDRGHDAFLVEPGLFAPHLRDSLGRG
ncbi:MAG: homoserine O-acetyltransferase [Acidimicrobiia bacterium]|nr:homoserine O-acetyltransferase [Acidimicrobiia bacterium]